MRVPQKNRQTVERKFTPEQISDLCEEVVGTTQFISDVLPDGIEMDDLSSEELSEIDGKIFICDECGWTCDIDEMADSDDEQICQECFEGRN